MTIGELLNIQVQKFANREALVYAEPPLHLSYREFGKTCQRVARGLLQVGLRPGDHVAIWAHNIPEWVIVQFATATMGAVLVTINTHHRAFELEYLLRHSDARALFMVPGIKDDEYCQILRALCPELDDCPAGQLSSRRFPLLRHVIYLGSEAPLGMTSWPQLLRHGDELKQEALEKVQRKLRGNDEINIQYTSGTTGRPKGVMLTHDNLIGNARSVAACLNLTQEDRVCIPVPFFHCFGCVLGTLTCVVSGAAMLPVPLFKAEKVLETVQKERCTALYGVPTMFIAELEEMEKQPYNTSSLRTGIMAGAPCPVDVIKAVQSKMGADEICITYGQTESSPAITMTRREDTLEQRIHTVGRALPNVEVKIVDPERGVAVPPGTQGELCTRGYLVMKGYYKMPQETEQVIDAQGWLHTGDLAMMDQDGYCKITGRLKDMIIRGGENIYPREIEEFLSSHPSVLDAQVVGVPSLRYGEETAAFIQLKQGENSSEEEIRAFCRKSLARHKVPEFILFVDTYPTTASGKVQKYLLREIAAKKLAERNEPNA